jgi:hypothetical protein
MKFEFVEFYEWNEDKRTKKNSPIGTVHIYAIDCELDIRGIRVFKKKENLIFCPPDLICDDLETGERIRYPIIRFTNEKTHREMLEFLRNEVETIVMERLNQRVHKNG